MKAKRILITFFNNGNIQSQVAKERIFSNVVSGLKNEGREVSRTVLNGRGREIHFEDGTKVYMLPFGKHVVGMRFTHLYIDEASLQAPNSKQYINEMYKSTVISGDYMNFDTSDQERMFVYSFNNGILFKGSLDEYGL
jgi:hypothetical protein